MLSHLDIATLSLACRCRVRHHAEACGTKALPAPCVAVSCGLLLPPLAEFERRSYAPRPTTPALYVKKPSSMGSSSRCTAPLLCPTTFHLHAATQESPSQTPTGMHRFSLSPSKVQPACQQYPVHSSEMNDMDGHRAGTWEQHHHKACTHKVNPYANLTPTISTG